LSRIIDLTDLSAVYGTRLLVEAGHEVIRVEPRSGDALRRLAPRVGNKPDLEHGAYHQFLNAGKRSVTLDLNAPTGRKVFLDLVGTASAVIANVPMPFEEELLSKMKTQLVVTKVEDRDPEICAFARTGLLSITGQPGKRPVLLGGHLIYVATGLYIAVATAAALYVLERTERGQTVSVSLKQCLVSLMEQAMVVYNGTGKVMERSGYTGAITAISGAFACRDGYWMVSVPHTSEGWDRFVEVVQDPVLLADSSLANEAERHEKKDLVLERVKAWSERFTREEIVREGQRRHIPASPVSTPLDLIDDPQLIARGFLTEMEHPEFGRILFPVGAIATVRGTEVGPAPFLGQHNAEILNELGYAERDQLTLLESGAV
jgi:crotonobetainyl-CoA:carnitine CoA-transferase CaiB-like acyl-CoA transferase